MARTVAAQPYHPPDPPHQQRRIERLADEILRADIDRLPLVGRAVHRGEHHHRQIVELGRLAQPPQQGEAGFAGHGVIEQQDIGALALNAGPGVLGAGNPAAGVPGVDQHLARQFGDQFIIGNQDAGPAIRGLCVSQFQQTD
jgi:hypothetical protein